MSKNMVAYIVLLVLATMTLMATTQKFTRLERRYIWGGYLAHAVAAVGQVVVTQYVYGGGDMFGYQAYGEVIAQTIRLRPDLLHALASLTMGGDPYQFTWVQGAGGSTGVMSAIAGWLCLVLNDSMVASCFALGLFAFVGQIFLYLAFRLHLPLRYHSRALFACFAVPSVVFWSSGILKETVALGGVGIGMWGVSRLVKTGKPTPRAIAMLMCGFWIVGLVKAYILFPLAIASLIWFFTERSRRQGREFKLKIRYVIPGILLSFVAVLLLGEVYPRFAVERVATETAQLQGAYRTIKAGSSYELGDPSARSYSDQVRFAPIALIASLLRPFIFEAHNGVAFGNSVETTVLLIFLIVIIWRNGPARIWRNIGSEPLLLFLTVYVLIFGIAVGLAAPNLGTLSRYRVPMFPMYWLLICCLLPMKRQVTHRQLPA